MLDKTNDRYASVGAETFRDAAGHAVFSAGDIGTAHVRAHRLLDRGQVALGRRELGRWLARRSGSGSEWVHIQFHMALFELGVGDWDAAHARFMAQILPAATTSEDALTDAPALLWHLQLLAPRSVDLPWQALRQTALKRMQRSNEPFVELHNLLALAGARDFDSIDRWVQAKPDCDDVAPDCVLRNMAIALRAYGARTYRLATEALESVLPQLPQLGGSRAQQQLFEFLASTSRQFRG